MKKTVIKILSYIIIMTLIGTAAVFAETTLFSAEIPSDIVGTPYEAAVRALIEKNIITGDTDGKFYPESNLTRAQACIIVVKSMNPPQAEITGTATQSVGKSGFSDMSGYGWAEGYIKFAVQNGVTTGYPDGTFKPGNIVTINELITMVLRAAGYYDENLGGSWPSNYVNKAKELELLTNMPSPLPTLATKWMAAQLDYNALSRIEAANHSEGFQGSKDGKLDDIPDAKSMTFANGSFNSNMDTYDGKTISNKAVIYTYGEKKDFSSAMNFSNKVFDYRKDTVYKYKNVKTPAFYKLVDGKITEMIVPMDVGFSGKAYCVINDTETTVNSDNGLVTGLITLTATREITWLGEKGLTGIPDSALYLQGEVYELNLLNGEIQSIFKAADGGKKGDMFEEISGIGALWDDVESFDDNVLEITAAHGGAMFAVKKNASVYVMDQSNQTAYKSGSLVNIKANVQVRAYDISDDGERSADIVVVLR